MPNDDATSNETIPETKEGNKTSYTMLPTNNTSTPNMAPDMGIPKTAANPALIPQITSLRLSESLNLSSWAKNEVIPAPICAVGPSFPAEPPNDKVISVASNFT